MLNIKLITIDGGTQSRCEINESVVDEYVESIKSGEKFPPVTVFDDGTNYYLADGFHRYFASIKAGKAGIEVEVKQGTLRDAIMFSLSANTLHGLRRNNADKRKCVMTLLDDLEWSDHSDRDIAKICNVNNHLVAELRRPEQAKAKKLAKKSSKSPGVGEFPEDELKEDDQSSQAIDFLTGENERLTDRLAVSTMDATVEEKALVAKTIEGLREEIRLLKIELSSVKISRDSFQAENAQLKKQIAMMRKQIDKK